MEGFGVVFPSSGALHEMGGEGGEKGGLRRSYSLGAIGQGYAPAGRHENLAAACLLIIALLCLGVMLYVLRPILIPFAVSLLFYYLLQPIVNALNQPPAVCCRAISNCCMEEDEEEEMGMEEEEGQDEQQPVDNNGEGTRKRSQKQQRHRRGQRSATQGSGSGGGWAAGVKSWVGELTEGVWRPRSWLLGSGSGQRSRRGYEPVAEPHDTEEGHHIEDDAAISPHDTEATDLSSSQQCWLLWYQAACPRPLSVLLAISVALGVFVGFGTIIYRSVQSLQKDWPIYEQGAKNAVAQINTWLDRIHVSLNDDLVPYIMDGIKRAIPTLLSDVWIVVANGALVLIFLVYMLGSPPQELPPGSVWRKIDQHIRRYIRLKTFVCAIIGLFVGTVLYLLQVPFAGLFALLTFVLNYIPNFGPIVATLLPLPLVLFSPDLRTPAKVLALVLPSLGHFFVGYYLEPRLFGEHLEVHPIIIILSLAFWSVLWGVSGMILSVPLIAIMRIVCQNLHHPYARVAVRIMEGRLLDFDDQGYLPTPQKDTKQCSAYRQRRQRQREQEENEGYGVVHKEGSLRRRHGHAHGKEQQQQGSPVLPPAIKPIGVAPASAGGGGGK